MALPATLIVGKPRLPTHPTIVVCITVLARITDYRLQVRCVTRLLIVVQTRLLSAWNTLGLKPTNERPNLRTKIGKTNLGGQIITFMELAIYVFTIEKIPRMPLPLAISGLQPFGLPDTESTTRNWLPDPRLQKLPHYRALTSPQTGTK